jgi:hypothetical protein
VRVCRPVYSPHSRGNCFHIKHKKCKFLCYEHIQQLYQWAKRLEMPMTRLVNALLAHALVRLEQGVENVHESAAPRRAIKASAGVKPAQHRGVIPMHREEALEKVGKRL